MHQYDFDMYKNISKTQSMKYISYIFHFPTLKGKTMTKYYVNKNAQPNGDHEVHETGCSWMPDEQNRTYLGDFASCTSAVAEAKKTYPTADGCAHCSPACHKS